MAKSKKSSKASAPKAVKEEVKKEAPKAVKEEFKMVAPKSISIEVKELSILDIESSVNDLCDSLDKYISQQRKKGYPASRLEKQKRTLSRFKLDYKVSPKQQ